MIPDANNYNPSPDYLRALLDRAGLSQQEAARRIGVPVRSMRYYLAQRDTGKRADDAPYPVQFAIEALAAAAQDTKCAAGRPA